MKMLIVIVCLLFASCNSNDKRYQSQFIPGSGYISCVCLELINGDRFCSYIHSEGFQIRDKNDKIIECVIPVEKN